MARAKKLKVYRMTIGFHDAYVAAPTQKAAAEAWGTDLRVFAHKEAELVTDPKLAKEPLAHPGKVIKRLRGSADEQVAALGSETKGEARAAPKGKAVAKSRAKAKPRPSRAALDKAEQALAAAEARHDRERSAFAKREAELERERKVMKAKQEKERERLEARRASAEDAYDEALKRWRN